MQENEMQILIPGPALYTGLHLDLAPLRRWIADAHAEAAKTGGTVTEVRFRINEIQTVEMTMNELVRRLTMFNPVEGGPG